MTLVRDSLDRKPGTHLDRSGHRSPWFNVLDVGAIADGSVPCTAAIQRAIDHCGQTGGGTVVVPSGIYLTGTLWMRSNVTLQLEAGAKLVGVGDIAAFPVCNSKWEGAGQPAHASLICGEGLDNVAITGRGIIDGGGEFWWELDRRRKVQNVRPRIIRLVDCRNVLIEGITLCNSGFWALNPTACDNVTIHNVTIKNPPESPNTDGINPDSCSNVHISDCHIDVGDDCIAIKSGTEDEGRRLLRPCENITITNCTMLRGHGGVVIGSETSGGVRNVVISNCIFRGTDRGIRLKSRRGRGSVVEDIRVSNIVMDEVLCPLVINMFYGCGAWDASRVTDQSPHPVNAGTPRFRRLRFSNITARRAKFAAAYVLGLPEMSVEDITFDDISIYLDPENTTAGPPAMSPVVPDLCRAGVIIRNAKNIKLRRIDITDQLGSAVSLTNAENVVLHDLGAQKFDSEPVVSLKNVQTIQMDPTSI